MPNPEPNRRDRKRLKTLQLLSGVGMRLFEREGVEAVTMEKIAAEADVAKGTLYNHFPTKEAVLAYAIHEQLGRDLEPLMKGLGVDAGFPSGVGALMEAMAGWCEGHRDYLGPYLRFRFAELQEPPAAGSASLPHDIVDVYALLIGNSQRAGEMRGDVDARHLAVLFHHLCLGALLRWMQAEELDLRGELGAAVEIFVQGAGEGAVRKRRRNL